MLLRNESDITSRGMPVPLDEYSQTIKPTVVPFIKLYGHGQSILRPPCSLLDAICKAA